MRRLVIIALLATSALAQQRETLAQQRETLAQQRGTMIENVAAQNDPARTYTLYLPTTYDAAKKHPALVILDPRGRGTSAAAIYREAAEEFGWILISSNDSRSDTTMEPNTRALQAIMPDVARRYATDPKRIYATGFSGTAMVAWQLGITTGGLAGVIGVGGRKVVPPERFNFAHYGFAGSRDFNEREMRVIDAALASANKVPHRFSGFDAAHEWIRPDDARHALGWFELVAMKNGTRAKDDALVAKLWERELARPFRGVDALEHRRALLRTFDGLRDVGELRQQVDQLANDPAIARERDEIARWDAFEAEFVEKVFPRTPEIFGRIRAERLSPTPTLLREYRVIELQKRATKLGAEGATARRLLEAVFAQVSYLFPARLRERKEYALAAGVIEVGIAIHPDRPNVWYNLAAAQSLAGEKKKALASLEKAISLGWTDRARIRDDADFAALREDPRFRAIVDGR